MDDRFPLNAVKALKKNKYLQFSMAYGLAALCYLIDKHEKDENYEECAIIIDVVKHIGETLNTHVPTTIEEALVWHIEEMKKLGFDGLTSCSNIPMYAEIIELEMGEIELKLKSHICTFSENTTKVNAYDLHKK